MRLPPCRLFPFLMLAACPESHSQDPPADSLFDAARDAPQDAGSDAAAPADFGGAPTATLQGRVIFDWYNGRPAIPARNKQIGVVGGGAATLTGMDGSYLLTVPRDTPFVLLANLPGEISVQSQLTVPAAAVTAELHVIDIDKYVGTLARLGAPSRAFDTGAVAVRFLGTTQGGYAAAIDAMHDGAFVFVGTSSPVPSTTTQSGGDTVYFYNVAPGPTRLTLTPPPGQPACRDARAPGSGSYLVTATTLTEIVLDCAR
ncbi:MAG TPA: hypothetical protein PKI03_05910 [Pseudomonadota bacterium]|nr:hypothetical protein [Pseudomonadota bacterium]